MTVGFALCSVADRIAFLDISFGIIVGKFNNNNNTSNNNNTNNSKKKLLYRLNRRGIGLKRAPTPNHGLKAKNMDRKGPLS